MFTHQKMTRSLPERQFHPLPKGALPFRLQSLMLYAQPELARIAKQLEDIVFVRDIAKGAQARQAGLSCVQIVTGVQTNVDLGS